MGKAQRPIRIIRRDNIGATCRRPDALVKISAMNGQLAFGYPLVPNIVRKDFGAGIAVNVMRRKIACHHVMARTSAELGWVQPHGLARPVAAFAVGSGIHDPEASRRS